MDIDGENIESAQKLSTSI